MARRRGTPAVSLDWRVRLVLRRLADRRHAGEALQRAPVRTTMITITGQDHVFTHTGVQKLIARSHAWIREVLDA